MIRNPITWYRIARELKTLEAIQEKEREEQRIRHETICWLSANGMLKTGVS